MANSAITAKLKIELDLECLDINGGDASENGNSAESQDESWVEIAPPVLVVPNPFDIELIVETIAEFLTFFELQNIRLVSKLWFLVSSREMKCRQTLIIEGQTNENPYLDKLLGTHVDNLRQFGKCCFLEKSNISDFERNPRYFQLFMKLGRIHTLTHFVMTAIISPSIFHQIMRTTGHHLTHLEIYVFIQKNEDGTIFSPKYFPICEQDSEEHMVFPNMLKFSPGMVSLSLSEPEIDMRGAVGTSLTDYTRNFPNLVEFILMCLPEVEDPRILQKFQLPKLRVLKISTMNPEGLKMSAVNNLLGLGFNIKVLEILSINARNPDIEPLKKFLEAQAGSLECIRLLCESASQDLHFEIPEEEICIDYNSLLPQKTIGSLFPMPEFPKMKAFKVDKTYVNNLAHILQTFPNMTSLHFNTPAELKWANVCPRSIKVFITLDTLIFKRISLQDFEVIANPKHFPNLNKIAIDMCDDDTFRKVIQLIPNLVGFACADNVLKNLRITDEGITGIKNIASIELNFDPDCKMVEYQRSWPYIGNCSELKDLKVRVTGDQAGEKSILYGILCAPKLKRLEIRGMQISNDLIKLLKHRNFQMTQRCDGVKNSYIFLNSTKIEDVFDMELYSGNLRKC